MKDNNDPIIVYKYECTNSCTLYVNPNFIGLVMLLFLVSIKSIMLLKHLLNMFYYDFTKHK